MKLALAQVAVKLNRSNIDLHLEEIKGCRADVIVFPELSLNGYMLQDKVYEDAFDQSELDCFVQASHNIDIVLGCALKVGHRIFNAGIYFSKGEIKHIHHKVHLPNYGMFEEARYYFKGECIEFFETLYGNTALVVCEDLWRGESIAELCAQKPEIIYVIANSPARDFQEEGLLIKDQWTAVLKTTALLCGAYVVFVNRVGFEDGMGFWGGSMIITPSGEIEAELKLFEAQTKTFELNKKLHFAQKQIIKNDIN
ncbi:nitrilase [Sulfurimonas sp. MAG313]|nr:nitrilase-related carbon-nitrogen hydrolase [Sulfurimonas sp. MAG313]MDF1879859.1 nitrilase [Sulfurimonas sp. MAG313]